MAGSIKHEVRLHFVLSPSLSKGPHSLSGAAPDASDSKTNIVHHDHESVSRSLVSFLFVLTTRILFLLFFNNSTDVVHVG
jgi:hypothetical protein